MNVHEHACDCPAHRAESQNIKAEGSVWAAWLPVLACAVCPACVTTYAKVLSLFGVGFGLSEAHHLLMLAAAVLISVSVSGWRTWRSGRAWPLATALTGASLIAVGHLAHEIHFLEWAGVLVLLGGGLFEQFRSKALRRRLLPQSS
jgi:hypothetical protein